MVQVLNDLNDLNFTWRQGKYSTVEMKNVPNILYVNLLAVRSQNTQQNNAHFSIFLCVIGVFWNFKIIMK